ncbi:[LysW]-aminoadipate kinase [candidate division KSB3 bacterium]|uniref:Putative [LysW]-aminoadipate kinase n=1 Tax=candidate division KSB3 bacterium TaxID=2044937 RepID=A0A9D5JWG0_9BACT|nr:[LysW]-aminoadipate kinase [candidate division KSB3 bacterium]MBD3324971.1 [LysW]-aminoadipate kinase [candidate division KSB3 bacterium]
MIVVKIGGSEGTDYQQICADIATHIKNGQQIIVVHGASHETNQLSHALDHPPVFITSVSGHESRRTDRKTLEIFIMAVAGKINTLIVESLQQQGVNAIGLTGCDGRLLMGERKKAIRAVIDGKRKIIRDDYTGKVDQVNTELLTLLCDAGYTPVIAPIALSDDHEAMNVDGDRAAAEIAGAIKADELTIFTNVPGLLKDISDPDSLIPHIPKAKIEDYMSVAQGRMKKKILGATEAITAGVQCVRLSSGKVSNPLSHAHAGHCTVIS